MIGIMMVGLVRGGTLVIDVFFFQLIIIYYIYTLPIYLFFIIPFSMLVDKINPKWKVVFYAIAGVIAGVAGSIIITLLSNKSLPDFSRFDFHTIYTFMIAGIAFYIADIIIKNIVQRLIDGQFPLN
ncbi:hypothetical protein [Halalkalibacter sp. APA_J-10(15)]|uniref:hypothetical protein n=1 Tax=Halalkalibacter sp. APA_J-10(15) TaxID=2933805 RepID=UPI001FF2233A|nr:hypothetical protein [Halalkalibacter sp. APA_J-10(15)]